MKGQAPRLGFVALAVVLAVAVPVVVLLAGSSGGHVPVARKLRLERIPSGFARGIVVYVDDPRINRPATLDGARRASITCVDAKGSVLARVREPWPFTGTDEGLLPPHVHVGASKTELARVRRCWLEDTNPRLEGVLR